MPFDMKWERFHDAATNIIIVSGLGKHFLIYLDLAAHQQMLGMYPSRGDNEIEATCW
jgi:hypothetical protein